MFTIKLLKIKRGDGVTCDVIDHNSNSGVSNVGRNETPESFLTSSVPELQSHLAINQVNQPKLYQIWGQHTVLSSRYIVLDRKSIPMVAWYVLSKLSYMNRVISEVLPTKEQNQ